MDWIYGVVPGFGFDLVLGVRGSGRGVVSRGGEIGGYGCFADEKGADMALIGDIWPVPIDGEVGWLDDEEAVDVDEFFLCAFGRTMTS